MNHRFSKSMFCLTIFAVMLLVTASVTTWKAAAQEPLPSPSLRAHPIRDSVDGWFWPLGNTLTLTIDDPTTTEISPDLTKQMTVIEDPTGSTWFNFSGEYDLKPGDLVTMKDETTTKTLVVSILSIDTVDVATSTVTGKVEPNAQVRLPVPGELFVTADPEGDWTANFQDIGVSLQPGMTVIAENFDEDGDQTSFDWYIPNPRIVASQAGDWFWTSEFNPGLLDIAIYESKEEGAAKLWSGQAEADQSGFAFIDYNVHGQDLVPGNYLVISDGPHQKSLVLETITMEVFDTEKEIMAGTAPIGREVWAAAGPWDWQERIKVIADSLTGEWLADFNTIEFDITEDMRPSSYAQIFDEDGDANEAGTPAPPPNPHFTVFPEWEWFDGMDWQNEGTVTISVEGKSECGAFIESPGNFFNGSFGEACDIEYGDIVTFAGSETTRKHVVQYLKVTDIDKSLNELSGIASEGALVHVWAHEREGVLDITADESGNWSVDFDDIEIDLAENMGGRSEIRDDEGNATAVDWYLPNPHFVVFPEWEWFDGMDWQYEGTVEISVAGKPKCGAIIQSPGNFFNGSFGEECDIEFGDEVTFKGRDTTQIHTVQNLAVIKVNPEDDLVKGTADPGVEIHVWPHATGQEILVTANPQGKWNADFAGIYDLMRGDGGRARIWDENGNATDVDWYIPRPILMIYPDAQWFDGNDFPDGATVEVTVAGKPECDLEIESWGGFFGGNFPEGCFVTTGDLVKYKQGSTTLAHTVENLAIKVIDKDADTVSGVADPGKVVNVWAWYMADGSTVEGSNTEVTTDEYGTWSVDYNSLGIGLEDGMGIQAQICDQNGNGTSVDLPVPNPRIVASITEDWFYLVDFIPGAALELSIYDSLNNELWHDTTSESDVNGFLWIDSEGWDLEPGDHVYVYDGRTTKDLIIEGFTFDVFDTTLGRLQGTAPEPFGRPVFAGFGWEGGGWSTEVNTDSGGNWVADYGGPVPEYSWVYAQIFDEDGDASELRPSPRSIMAGNFAIAWSQNSPEEIFYLSWKGSGNLTNSGPHWACSTNLEFFGNSWVSENEGTEPFFFASLVGCAMGGTWSQNDALVNINSVSWANIPIQTSYHFFDDEARVNMIEVQRIFDFGEAGYTHDIRPYIPRLYPIDGFTQVLHPDAAGSILVTQTTDDCGYGCMNSDWNETWFAIHNPITGSGVVVLHVTSAYDVALWLDNDAGSSTNATSVLLLQPSGGFTGTVTETEYLCFYDSGTWTPSLDTLPAGCQP